MMLLGAIVRDITDPFFAGAIEAVSSAARARGYNIVLGLAHARATEALELAAILEARQCDGILLLGDMGDQPRLLADLRDSHVPVVTMWQGTRLDLIPGVQVDNRLGTRIAVEHLIGLGHRRIAFIGGRLLGDIRERQSRLHRGGVGDPGRDPEGLPPARGEHARGRRGRARRAAAPVATADGDRRLDRRPRDRRPARRPPPRREGPRRALGGRVRRHPDGEVDGPGPHHDPDADRGHGRRGDRARRRPGRRGADGQDARHPERRRRADAAGWPRQCRDRRRDGTSSERRRRSASSRRRS